MYVEEVQMSLWSQHLLQSRAILREAGQASSRTSGDVAKTAYDNAGTE